MAGEGVDYPATPENRDSLVTRVILEPDEPAAIPVSEARGEAGTWDRIPRSYIRFSLDRLIPPALQDRFIAEADRLTPGNPTDVHTVAAPHVGPFHRPELVDIFDGLATAAIRSDPPGGRKVLTVP